MPDRAARYTTQHWVMEDQEGPQRPQKSTDFEAYRVDVDPAETGDWTESLDAVVAHHGVERAYFLLNTLLKRAQVNRVRLPALVQTPYINTIRPEAEPVFPGDEEMERRIRRIIRWNAVAMVVRANHNFPGIGGHLATYASAANLYEVGFNHFFRGKTDTQEGDQVFFQGHSAPGIYALAFLEGASPSKPSTSEGKSAARGLPTIGRGCCRLLEFRRFRWILGRSTIYQARFSRYLPRTGSELWRSMSGVPRDERPTAEAGGAVVAAREGLDNLIFVVNCNLQRLDGPVRGNGKIIQELEAIFHGSGWNVIKVIWGREWDAAWFRRGRRAGREDERTSTASSRSTRSPAAPTSASTSSGRTRGFAGSWSTSATTISRSSAGVAMTTGRCTRRTGPRPSSAAPRR